MSASNLLGLLLAILIATPLAASAEEIFHPPQRIKADGKIIDTGKSWGHSGPCAEDLDGDGLKELIVGDFGGKFHVYRNIGTPAEPKYESNGKLQARGEDAEVRIYCCIGSQPRFADLDGDGLRDMISNSYDPGHCYLFRRTAQNEFAAREEMKDKTGVPIRSEPEQKQDFQSFGSFFTPVDWDADGDSDLLIGCFDGHLRLRINEGDTRNASFVAENRTVVAGGEPLKVKAHCGPAVADWDGDSLWDIVAGSDDGSVTWFRNTGTKRDPQFAKGVPLVAPHDGSGYNVVRWSEAEVVPGIRSQVEVVDHNGDGKLDLLVGDFCTAYAFREDLTDSEKQRVQDLIKESDSIGKAFSEKYQALRDDFAKRYPDNEIYSDDATKAWSKEYQALRESEAYKAQEAQEAVFVEKMRPFLSKTSGEGNRSFELAMSHGYVWLYLRR